LRSISRTHGRAWANDHPSTVAALRAMFSDAVEDNLADKTRLPGSGAPPAADEATSSS
jgi:hypothetical protein